MMRKNLGESLKNQKKYDYKTARGGLVEVGNTVFLYPVSLTADSSSKPSNSWKDQIFGRKSSF